MKLAKYPLPKNIASFLQKEKFFYLLYNFTKSHLSIEYQFQELSKARRALLDMVYSINSFLEYRYSEYPNPNSNAILGFCEKIDKLNSPFKQKSAIHKKNLPEIKSFISELYAFIDKKKEKIRNFKIQDDVSFTLSIISEGFTFSAVERLFAKNGISTCNERKFYRILEKISSPIIMYTNSICFQNFNDMNDGFILSFDCVWAHSRKSNQCFGALINVNTDKVIGWNVAENEELSPQSLEAEVLKSLKKIYMDDRVVGHIQDGDVATINSIQEWNQDIQIYFDQNHLKGKMKRILEKFNKIGNGCFNPIKLKLVNFFKFLLTNKTLSVYQKKYQWVNVVNHFLGEHGLCLHSYRYYENCPDPNSVHHIHSEETVIGDDHLHEESE